MDPPDPLKLAEERYRRGEITRSRLTQLHREAEGLCTDCGTAKPDEGRKQCGNCLRKRAEHTARRRRGKATIPGCGKCGQPGHNRRTCPTF